MDLMDQREAAKRIQKDFEDLFYTAVGFSVLSGKRIYTTLKDITKDSGKADGSASQGQRNFFNIAKPVSEATDNACKLFKHFAQSVVSNIAKHQQESDPREH